MTPSDHCGMLLDCYVSLTLLTLQHGNPHEALLLSQRCVHIPENGIKAQKMSFYPICKKVKNIRSSLSLLNILSSS